VLLLAVLLDEDPDCGRNTLTLRPWKLLLVITGTLAREWRITRAEAFEALLKLSPHALLTRLRQVLVSPQVLSYEWTRLEPAPVAGGAPLLAQTDEPALLSADAWSTWREITGRQVPTADALLPTILAILPHCRGLVVGDHLDRRNYLDSTAVLADPDTAGASLRQLLQDIRTPAYRQLNLEALSALAGYFQAHPELRSDDYLVLDVIIGTAVYLAWREANPEMDCHAYSECCAQAWDAFYAGPPDRLARCFPVALRSLLEASKREAAAA
jgi:phosphorylase kinase alpha/beta subunit